MRSAMPTNAMLWGTAVIFLLAALYTVSVRRQVYRIARENGALEAEVVERRRRCENLAIERDRLLSPADLRRRAEARDIQVEVAR